MAHWKHRKGGQGGKKGHSNMSHWTGTEEIKHEFKRTERRKSKLEIKKEPSEASIKEK